MPADRQGGRVRGVGAKSARRGLHQVVVEAVALDIVKGRFQPGDSLPIEADLGQELGVGRSSVREAMRVLSDKGLIEVRTRTGARVTDPSTWRRLDPDVVRWSLANGPDTAFLAYLLEARRIVEPKAAALASVRASAADLAEMERALAIMSASLPDDMEACVNADAAFHYAVLMASGNPVLQEFESIIDAAMRVAFTISASLARSYALTISCHHDVFDAIRLREPERAEAAMSALLDLAATDLGLTPEG
ncbi:FadR/GntR family transcriptional regulator [Roseisalinus antarcticus]|uniref:FadR/GntR family transcriptional regulator n=1 Tax=Roseisalinus antarcticus TaxID=254357 RepID=UPI00135637B4|nr:FadR/GntR family transcriptional regulator [Roseisalinus antarcticus]